jgi:hypothetical protein
MVEQEGLRLIPHVPQESPEAQETAAASSPSPAYTPAALLKAVQAVLLQRDPGTKRMTRLRTIPQRKNQEGVYGGYVFCQLRDPHASGAFVEGRLPESLAPLVEWGRETVFTGLVDYRIYQDKINPQFLITGIEGVGEARQAGKDELARAWQDAVNRPKRDCEAALQKERPIIGVVTGTTGIVIDDVRREL